MVIFDCDGVLVDSEVLACRIDSETFAGLGIAITPEGVMSGYAGMSGIDMLEDVRRTYGANDP